MTLALDVLLSDTGAIARRLSGFEVRPQQMLMAGAVERAFEERQRLFVEAGTGVGKSFAYLLPAIRRIVERGERVVVATNTISLQGLAPVEQQLLARTIIRGEPGAGAGVNVRGTTNRGPVWGRDRTACSGSQVSTAHQHNRVFNRGLNKGLKGLKKALRRP